MMVMLTAKVIVMVIVRVMVMVPCFDSDDDSDDDDCDDETPTRTKMTKTAKRTTTTTTTVMTAAAIAPKIPDVTLKNIRYQCSCHCTYHCRRAYQSNATTTHNKSCPWPYYRPSLQKLSTFRFWGSGLLAQSLKLGISDTFEPPQ